MKNHLWRRGQGKLHLLFETGYLTKKETYTKNERKRYRLACPNEEVRESFRWLRIQDREWTGRPTQIKQMRYHEKYLNSGKDIVLLGIGFDPQDRNIGNYLVEMLILLIPHESLHKKQAFETLSPKKQGPRALRGGGRRPLLEKRESGRTANKGHPKMSIFFLLYFFHQLW